MYQLHQLINEPTRITDTSKTCIDYILVQSLDMIKHSQILPKICSDHSIPCVFLKCSRVKVHSFKRTIYNYKKLNKLKYHQLLSSVDWNDILLNEEINVSTKIFTDTLFDIAKQCMPSKTVKVKTNDAPWINEEIRLLIAEKNKIHKKAKQSNKEEDWANFRRFRNKVVEKIRQRKKEYVEEIDKKVSDQNNFNTKDWWKLVHSFWAKKGLQTNEIPPLEANGHIYYSNKEKSDLLNNFFVSQSTLEDDDDPHPDIPYPTDPVLNTLLLSENDIKEAIKNLDETKAVGPDLIHNILLKTACNYISNPLTKFFNKCLNCSTFPDLWKLAHIAPIYKKGPREKCNNYRPISLLSCVGKLFESCVHKHLLHYLRTNNILNPCQSGFLPGDSAINQLLSIYNNLCYSFDQGLTTQAVYLDITKAFDRVWHKGLIAKLESVGVRGRLLNWFCDYLHNRKQITVIKGSKSTELVLKGGVPQGSVLGPLLFLIYINDIAENIESVIKLFADDTSLSLAIQNPQLRANILNHDLQKISDWALLWKVKFNETKTEILNYTKGSEICLPLSLNNTNLEVLTQHKHLGIILQSNFKWDAHVTALAAKVSNLISCLKSYKYRFTRKTLEILYKSFVLPHFDYGDIIWDNCSETLSTILENLHLEALRTISGSVRGTSHQKLYNETGFTTLKERRNRHKLIQYKKIALGLCPNYLSNLLPPLVSQVNPYHRRNPLVRTVPRSKTETYNRSFFPSTSKLWNDLSLNMLQTDSLSQFKRNLSYNDTCVPSYYYIGERREQVIQCKMRLGMSDLNYDLYHRHIAVNSSCACGYASETAAHYLLFCNNYVIIRQHTINLLPIQSQNIKTLLFGDNSLQCHENNKIFLTVHNFIKESMRFNN